MTLIFKEKSSPILGATHLLLTISSGWSLKNVTQNAYYSIGAFTLSFIYSIIGLLRFTHPNPTTLRRLSNLQVFHYLQLLLPLLFAVDVLKLTEKTDFIWYITTITMAIISCASIALHRRLLSRVFDVFTILLLAYVAYFNCDECYWTVGLFFLIFLNNFVFERISSLDLEITHLEISTIGLSFFVVFALNSINEIAMFNSMKHNIK